jgi:hypothetical protein
VKIADSLTNCLFISLILQAVSYHACITHDMECEILIAGLLKWRVC